MGLSRLREPFIAQGTVDANGNVTIPIIHNAYERVLEIQQISVNYATQGDNPNVQIMVNGEVYSGPAVMLPGAGKGYAGGLGQSFGGYPYLYMEAHDSVSVQISNGSLGTIVNIRVQYRSLSYDASELDGYQ